MPCFLLVGRKKKEREKKRNGGGGCLFFPRAGNALLAVPCGIFATMSILIKHKRKIKLTTQRRPISTI
jgi:hypothetical protein